MKEMTPEAHTLKVGPDGREHLQCRGRQPSGTQGSTMICIDLTQQNTNDPDRRRRHERKKQEIYPCPVRQPRRSVSI